MYKITLTGLTLYGYHGVSKAEKELGQAAKADKLEKTINYVEVFELVEEIFESETKNLLESVANSIASKMLDKFNIESITVKISKSAPPVPHINFSNFAIEVFKQKN